MTRKSFLVLSVLFISSVSILGEIRVTLKGEALIKDIHSGLIKVGKDGRIYIADHTQYNIKIFSKNGKYLSKFGRLGEGPGDFKRWFGEFTIAPDGNVYQVDYWAGNRRITVFDPGGNLLKTFRVQMDVPNFGPERIFVMKNGDFLMAVSRDFLKKNAGEFVFLGSNMFVYLFDKYGKIKKELVKTEIFYEFSIKAQGGGRPFPFRADFICDYSPKGIIAYQKSNEELVHLLNIEKHELKSVSNGFKKKKITRKEFVSEIKQWLKYPFRKRDELLYKKLINYGKGVEDYRPIVDRIMFDPEGNLYIAAFDRKTQTFSVNLVSSQGQQLRSFNCKNFPAVITKDKVYFLKLDEEEDLYDIKIRSRKVSHFKSIE